MKAIFGFESVILPNNSQRDRYFRANKLSHKQSFTTFSVAKRLKMVRATNRAGVTSSFLFIVLVFAIIFPLYNIMGTEDTKAAVGTEVDSSITFTSTRNTASVTFSPTSTSGTFASSTAGTSDAAFSLSTTNSQGYTLNLKSSNGTALKASTSATDTATLSAITSSGIESGSFTMNTWGYLPSYYNSTTNTTKYYPATTSDVTLRTTTTANSTAHSYTIGIGAKADLTREAGTYTLGGNKGSLVLTYVANPTAYEIAYRDNSGDSTIANMPTTTQSGSVSATSVALAPNRTPTRTGYSLTGWCLGTVGSSGTTCTGTTIATNGTLKLDRTTSNSVTLYAIWTPNKYTCTKQYRLQNADGTWGNYTTDTTEQVTYNSTCSYSKNLENYKGTEGGANDSVASTSAIMNSTEGITVRVSLWRNTYALTVTAGSNTSSATGGGTYRWGQTVTVGVAKASNTTCITYNTPTWSRTSGSGTLNATSGTSVTFTMTTSNATVTATSGASNVAQTITLSRSTGASGITIAGTNYTGTSASLNCGTYNISGNYSSNYEFSSWSRANGVAVANTSSSSTTMTVSGAGTLTLNAKSSCTPQTTVSGTMQAFCPASSIANGTSGTLTDSRGGTTKSYTVAKLADGKWWMTNNLDLPGGTTLTSSDSNVSSNYTLPASSSSPKFTSDTTATVYNSGSTNCSASMGCYSYYSYLAATAGTGSSVSTHGYNASGSICPKGWRLPTSTTSNADPTSNNNWKTGDFYALATAYGANLESNYYDSNSSTSGKFYTNAGPGTTPNFLLSGIFYGGTFLYGGSDGYYWSSTAKSSDVAYSVSFNSSSVLSANSYYRRFGFAVRCVYAG